MIHLKCLLLLYKSLAVASSVIPSIILLKIYCIREKILVIHKKSESYSIFHINVFFCPKFGLFTEIFFKCLQHTHR